MCDVETVEMSDEPVEVNPVDGTPTNRDQRDSHGTLLVDAMNGFNELSCKAMLWTV